MADYVIVRRLSVFGRTNIFSLQTGKKLLVLNNLHVWIKLGWNYDTALFMGVGEERMY